jgi:delta-aminolevulinic acid dehydratase/porphobilinogen synthase
MPGVVQHTRDSLRAAANDAVEAGVGGLMLFAIPSVRDSVGTEATETEGALNVMIRDRSRREQCTARYAHECLKCIPHTVEAGNFVRAEFEQEHAACGGHNRRMRNNLEV